MATLIDLIVIQGRNYYPQDIERTVEQSHPALRPGCGAAFSVPASGEERLIVVQEVDRRAQGQGPQIIQAVRKAVAGQHELQAYGVVLLQAGSIPKTSSGKIEREACRTAFLSGRLEPLAQSILDAVPPETTAVCSEKSFIRKALETIGEPAARQTLVTLHLQEQVGRILRCPPSQIDLQQPVSASGLDSLMAIELMHDIELSLGVRLPAETLFQDWSLTQLAGQILEWVEPSSADQTETTSAGPATHKPGAAPLHVPPLVPVGRDRVLPASFAQQRLWFLDQLQPGSPLYHIPVAVCIEGPLDVAALRQSLGELARRQESLRTTLVATDGELAQEIVRACPLSLSLVDLRELPDTLRQDRASELARAEARRPFDLAHGPLWRAVLLQLRERQHILLLVFHHIVADGWSFRILNRELAALYDAFAHGRHSPLAELPIQYADWAVWQKEWLQESTSEWDLAYWKQRLAGLPAGVNLPTDRRRPPVKGHHGATVSKELGGTLSDSLAALNRRWHVTPFMVLLTALKILLFRWTGQADLAVGTVVADRHRSETDALIGCFVNFLALRSQAAQDLAVQEYLEQVRATVVEALAHQDCPFDQVVQVVNPQRLPNQDQIYNVAFVMQDVPEQILPCEALTSHLMPLEMGTSLLDLRFVVYASPDGFRLECEYDTDLFEADTIRHLGDSYSQVLEALVQHPETRLSDVEISPVLQTLAQRARERDRQQTVAIAATFTANLVEDALGFWLDKLGIPARIEFAPYHQVFQQLLAPDSLLVKNRDGVNIVLVRLEDWARAPKRLAPVVSPSERERILAERSRAGSREAGTPLNMEKIEQSVDELVLALKSAGQHSTVPYLVCLCPPSPSAATDAATLAGLDQMQERLASELEAGGRMHVIRTTELLETYPVSTYYDPEGDELAHIPFTPVFFAALGTMLARKIHAIESVPHKVIALDCDNTLWQGVCGEDGALDVKIDQPRRLLHEFMVDQRRAGMLLCLCSKNHEADVLAVLDHHPEMRLRREHLAAWRINWQPKSANLKALAQELQLGLDSFVFLDDDPVECAEVRINCPQVLTLQLPRQAEEIARFLRHVWVFDHAKVTEEGRQRAAFYAENRAREELRKSLTLKEFLAGLDLQIQITEVNDAQLARVSELTQRTNQFNMTTVRRSEGELRRLLASDSHRCLVAHVRDRFGDYGLVGVILLRVDSQAVVVDTFLLSCRALGRGVEHWMLAQLGDLAKRQGLDWVLVPYVPTPRNEPALYFLRQVGTTFGEPLDRGFIFKFPAELASAITCDPAVVDPGQPGG